MSLALKSKAWVLWEKDIWLLLEVDLLGIKIKFFNKTNMKRKPNFLPGRSLYTLYVFKKKTVSWRWQHWRTDFYRINHCECLKGWQKTLRHPMSCRSAAHLRWLHCNSSKIAANLTRVSIEECHPEVDKSSSEVTGSIFSAFWMPRFSELAF